MNTFRVPAGHAFVHPHQTQFICSVILDKGETTPSRDTYLRLVQRLDPETAVKAAFDEAERGAFAPEVQDVCETVERNGGRTERRTCTVLHGPGLCEWVADPEAWPGLIRVQAERTGPRGRRQRSVRYYISSRPVDAAGPTGTRQRPLGGSRTACTAPWMCNSGRTTAACARGTRPP